MKHKAFFFLLFLIPFFLIFKSIFLGGELSFGDAPYFYPENLKELFYPPFIWDVRYINFGGLQSNTLWLYIPTFLFGFLNHLLGLNSEFLLRAIFIIPSSFLAFFGAWKLFKLFSENIYGRFLCAFFFVFNTYYILLIDGGQVGVALAYGLFPWVILTILNYQKKASLKNFIAATVVLFLITNVDIRIAFISILYVLIFSLLKFQQRAKIIKSLLSLILVVVVTLLLDSFWIYPLIKNLDSLENFSQNNIDINLVSILNSLLLYQPHFPVNDFGKIIIPPFYFILLPAVIFSGLLFIKKNTKVYLGLCFIFLIFAFLSKGKNIPLGELYGLIDNISYLGIIFRDSSKFLIPTILTVGVLLGLSYELISRTVKRRNSIILFIATYIFLIALVSPALFGDLSGGLNNPVDKQSFIEIHKNLSLKKSFFRTLWFDERPPLGFSSWDIPGISANNLYLKRPFADMIEGSYDLNGFLNSPQLKEWLNISGVKYLFFPENERKKTLTQKQRQERKLFLNFIDKLGFKKLDWKTKFPIYKVEGSLPHVFAVDNIFLVSGGDEIYFTLNKNKIPLQDNPIAFIDDQKSNLDLISKLLLESNAKIVIQGNKNDLVFSLLRDEMLDLSNFGNNWAKKKFSDYLSLKGELLERGIRNFDYDFGKGVSYSTINNEKINISKKIDKSSENILAIRYLTATESAGIRLRINSDEKTLKSKNSSKFEWTYFNLSNIDEVNLEIKNQGGISVVNTVLVVSEPTFKKINEKIDKLLSGKEVIYINEGTNFGKLRNNQKIIPLKYRIVNPTEYEVKIPNGRRWIIFTDSFDKGWILENSKCRLPSISTYSFINGFYIAPTCEDTSGIWRLYYKSQEDIKVGIFLSLIFSTTLILVLIGLIYKSYGIHHKNN